MYWHGPTANTPDNEGFWSVATYAETFEVLRDPVMYSSVTGGEPVEWTRSNRHTGNRHLVVAAS